jgi:fused signal recognition particle receptor
MERLKTSNPKRVIMFGFLKKKLSESVEKLSERIKGKEEVPQTLERGMEKPEARFEEKKPEEKKLVERVERPVKISEKEEKPKAKPPEKPRHEPKIERKVEEPEIHKVEKTEKPAEKPVEKKAGLMDRLTGKVLERKISENDIDSLFEEMELGLMEANMAIETIDFIKSEMKRLLVGKQLKRGEIEKDIRTTLEKILLEIFDQGRIDLEKLAKAKKPICIVFLGFNGSGKTTSIAKLGQYLKQRKFQVVLAAGDTWRSAAIEQLEVHGERLGIKVIKHEYGADSAAVVYDAIEHAKAKGIDFVLADTAGRSHANRNLMDELKKVVRVNKPDLKILVMDSLAGNDLVEQAKNFDEAVGVDCMIFTKVDVNEKGGGMLSACLAVKKPILYIGKGQEYKDIELFDANKFVKDLMEGG